MTLLKQQFKQVRTTPLPLEVTPLVVLHKDGMELTGVWYPVATSSDYLGYFTVTEGSLTGQDLHIFENEFLIVGFKEI